MDELVICIPAESHWGVVFGVEKCVRIPILRAVPEFPPVPPDYPLLDWRALATIDLLAGWLSGDRGVGIRREVDALMEAANRQLDGEAALSRRARG